MISQEVASSWRFTPLLRFVLLGLTLWLGKSYIEWREYFVVEAPSNEALELNDDDWARRVGHFPSEQQQKEIFHTELEDRVLFKEAVRLKLYVDDPVVYQRLLKNAEFIGIQGDETEKIKTALSLQLHLNDELIRRHLIEKLKTLVRARIHPIPLPSDDLLRSRYLAERDRWKIAPNIEMEHIFFSADRPDTDVRVAAARRKLDHIPLSGEKAYSLGDKFLFGNHLSPMELTRVKDRFGREFAESLQDALNSGAMTVGAAAWYGPVKSSYGFHFVKIISYKESAYQSFEEVKGVIIEDYNRELEAKALAGYLAGLLDKYEVTEP